MRGENDVTRRELLRSAAIGTVALASDVDNLFGQPAFGPPNIIFIMADDLGYADVSCYGRSDVSTPNIYSLAANGMRFLQAYANSAVCSATRTALITGRYQYRLPIGLEEPLRDRDVGLPPGHHTLPSQLRKAGYGTTLVGKWHLGTLPKYGPLQSGYDHFYGFRGGDVGYFLRFAADYPAATSARLSRSYRSAPTIVPVTLPDTSSPPSLNAALTGSSTSDPISPANFSTRMT